MVEMKENKPHDLFESSQSLVKSLYNFDFRPLLPMPDFEAYESKNEAGSSFKSHLIHLKVKQYRGMVLFGKEEGIIMEKKGVQYVLKLFPSKVTKT